VTTKVMVVPVSAWDTGQFVLASWAAASNASASIPGTTPRTESLIPVMPAPGWKVTSARVSMLVGGVPAVARPRDSDMEKQVEWAAAISSSGLVLPLACSARAGQLTSKLPAPEETSSTSPWPSFSEPSQ
jgi:hypothetical protein